MNQKMWTSIAIDDFPSIMIATKTYSKAHVNDSVMHFRSFSRKRHINTLVTVTVTAH